MLYLILATASGLFTVISRMVNAALGRSIGSLQGSFINHAVGTLGAAAILVLGWRTGGFELGAVPWIYWTGGCIGVLIVAASNYAVAVVGATLFSVLLLTGQIFTSAVIDHFGLLGETQIPMRPAKLAGLGLLLVGALLVLTDRHRTRPEAIPAVPPSNTSL